MSEDKFAADLSRNSARGGDLIYTQRGTLGKVSLLDPAESTHVVSQSQMRLRVDKSQADPLFVYYASTSPHFNWQIDTRAISTGVPHINLGLLGEFEIPLPALSEQRAISAMLGALDDKIESNRRKSFLIWKLAASTWEHLTQHAAPAPLAQIMQLAYGKALPAKTRTMGDVPVYGSSGVTGWHNASLADGPAVIIGRKGTVGSVHWSDVASFPIDTTFVVRPQGDWPVLACYFAARNAGLSEMNSDSAVPGLNRERALAAETVLPAVDAASAWANHSMPSIAFARQLDVETKKLEGLRHILVPELLSGRLRAPVSAT